MTRRFEILFLFVLAVSMLALPALGAERELRLAPDASDVSFTLGATGHKVAGHLYLRDGWIRFDPETGMASGEVTIDATRAETGHKKRDATMHRKVLESERHPLIVFRPQRLEGALAAEGVSEVQLIGSVSLLGVDHPLTLPARVDVRGDKVSADTTFSVPYVEWGLHDPSVFILRVAKSVDVTISATGSLAVEAESPAPAGR